jgi:gamma-glutamyltranspeptidase/glutathione hydrolase
MTLRDFQRRLKGTNDSSRGTQLLARILALSTLSAGVALARPPTVAVKATTTSDFGVAVESATASREAAKILLRGGSAADAAIVAALVAGITAPTSSGIGGGGFAIYWDALANQPVVLDFREVGPRGLTREPFERRPLGQEEAGHLIGVPGEIRGLFELHKRAGKRPWAELVKVAATRAHEGFLVERHLGGMLSYAKGTFSELPGFSGLYYPGGAPALVGRRLTNSALGRSLDRIAQEGPDAFYSGPIAEDLVRTAQKHGSSLSLDDLKDYRPKERTPLHVSYEGYDVYTMPAPSAGGLMMAEVLQLLPADTLMKLGHGTPAYQHLLAEAMRGAIADRMRYLADPDFEKIDFEKLLSAERMARRRTKISLERTHALPRFALDEQGTQALVTKDRRGNVVSLTTTINQLFGSKIMAEDSGVVLNNELDDFTEKSAVLPFGMEETPNRPRAGARPVSSMTPTIVVKDGVPMLALGGSGGTAIATNAVQTLLAALVFGHRPEKAVAEDRIYIPTKGAHIAVEKGTSTSHKQNLERRGEVVTEMRYSSTAIQMLRFENGQIQGAADPRKFGLAVVGK